MNCLTYKNNTLHIEGVSVMSLAKKFQTPLYVYSHQALADHFDAYEAAFKEVPHVICFAVKSNSNLSVIKTLAKRGSGADIVSAGELYRARKAGVPAKKIVFSGVGKTASEIEAALRAGILMFNVESEQELTAIDQVARRLKKQAPIAIRVNPDVDAQTHPYISTGMKKNKFGTNIQSCLQLYKKSKKFKNLNIIGLSCHIGSQITQMAPFVDAISRLRILIEKLAQHDIVIRILDLGGGLGISYDRERPPAPAQYGVALKKALKGLHCTIVLEPGRSITGNTGIFVTQVVYTKKQGTKNFVIVDGAMNDLVRPSLYQAYHEIVPVKKEKRALRSVDVVGPICETGDFLAQDRRLPEFKPGELMALKSAGAYGFTMASNYNSRPRTAEVIVKGRQAHLVRERETLADLVKQEVSRPYFKG
jgi:diaminopimelate decarboxylase